MGGCCKSCSMALYGEDQGDFAGLISRTLLDEGYGLLTECDECGPALVDIDGQRINAELCDA